MSVRPAEIADIPQIVEMGKTFQGQTVHGQMATFDPWSFRSLCVGLISDDTGALFVTEDVDGMAAALVVPCMFNLDVMVATELWVYTQRPGKGRALLTALEIWGKSAGATSMAVTSQLNMKDVTAFYNRLGFEPVEKLFVKRL